jgi:hypothetical protein
MELPIKHKRGTTVPTANDLVVGELAINTATGVVYTKTGAGNVVSIGSGGTWGTITGNMDFQTDLILALADKVSKSVSSDQWMNGTLRTSSYMVADGGFISSQLQTNQYLLQGGIAPGLLSTLNWTGVNPMMGNQPVDLGESTFESRNDALIKRFYINTKQVDYSDTTAQLTTFENSLEYHAGSVLPPFRESQNQFNLSLTHSDGATTSTIRISPKGIRFSDDTLQETAGYPLNSNPSGYLVLGDDGVIPAGGLEGQVLLKASDLSYDTAWFDNYAATMQATVRNETGATLVKGTVVYISGGSGNKPLVSKASASTEEGSSKTFAILAADIATNHNGQAVTLGLLKGIDTSLFTAGANLWLSTVAGEIVSPNPPAPPAHSVFLGNVVRVHATQGEIEVRIQNGYELGELHDVLLTAPTNGQVLKYDSASGLWKNGTDVAGVAWGGITGTLSSQTDLQNALNLKANLSGATFTGKVNFTSVSGVAGLNIGIGGTSTSATTSGDLWISTGGTNLNFRDGTGAWRVLATQGQVNSFSVNQIIECTTTVPALRVTQRGTGHSLVIEDGNPYPNDSSAFAVDQHGNVGIGVNATGTNWVAQNRLEIVNGYGSSTSAPANDDSTRLATTAHVKSVVRGSVLNVSSMGGTLAYTGIPNMVVMVDEDTSAAPGELLVPSETQTSIPVGVQYVVIQTGTIPVSIVSDGFGAVVNSHGNKYTTGGQHAVCTLIKTAVNEWYLAGNLV